LVGIVRALKCSINTQCNRRQGCTDVSSPQEYMYLVPDMYDADVSIRWLTKKGESHRIRYDSVCEVGHLAAGVLPSYIDPLRTPLLA
jgi:hypothetical protein